MIDRPVVAYTDPGELDPQPGVDLLQEAGYEVRMIGSDDPREIVARAPDVNVLMIGYTPIDATLLRSLPALNLICTQSAGFDSIDMAAATAAGVRIANVPGAASEEVATHALAMALGLLRGIPFHHELVRAGHWDGTLVPAHRLSEVSVGVLGLGRIGRWFAEAIRPLVREVVGHDPGVPDHAWPKGVVRVDLESVLRRSQLVSLHLPLAPGAEGLIGAREIGLMPRSSYLVNVARGQLVDLDALVSALDSGHLAGAALDVLPVEPPGEDSRLHHPRLWLSPHAAYLSDAAARDYVVAQAQNAISWLHEGSPGNLVTG